MSATADAFAAPAAPAIPSRVRAWLAIAAGATGGFMALLDTSIANAALPVIQGEIGATRSEATWIGTAYLTTEIIVIPLVAWLERVFGMRRFLLLSALIFTAFSIVCGSATNLTLLIFGRLGQGLSGGMMMPTAFSLVARMLPPADHARGTAIISGPILVAPIIGPLLGGWLTENYSWHYAFLINVPICGLLLVMLFAGMPRTPPDWSELRKADWFGVAGMAIALGSLTVLLEEGNREHWFESALIWQLAGGTLLGIVLVAVGQIRAERPVISLALLHDPALAIAMLLLVVIGANMFCMLYMVPQFLVALSGYNALQAGQVILYSGIASTAMMFVYQPIVNHLDIRIIVGVSLLFLSLCSYLTSDLTADVSGQYFIVTQVIMGSSLAMGAIPLQQVAIALVDEAFISEITSIVTVSRNLGGSIGLAGLASLQDQRFEFHHWRLHEAISTSSAIASDMLEGGTALFGSVLDGAGAGPSLIDGMVMRQALVMTFNDCFFALTLLALASAPLALLLRSRGRLGAAAMGAH